MERGIDAAVLVETADLYYLTGSVQDSHLLVPADGEPVLYVRRSLERAQQESPIRRIEPLRSLRELPEALARAGVGSPVGFELDVLPAKRFLAYADLVAPRQITDCSDILRSLRSTKSAWEVERVERAALLLDAAFEAAHELLGEGMTELELQAELERTMRRAGHDGFVRARVLNQEMHYGFVLAGRSGAVPGGVDAAVVGPGTSPAVGKGSSFRPIGGNEPVLIDLVGASEGYLADATRTFVCGALEPELAECLERSREILTAVVSEAGPGVLASRLYERALELAGNRAGFMGLEPVSFVGHGVGLEIGEPPYLARGYELPLEVGHVFALEPKFVIEGKGAVGVEDTFVVEETGVRQLTRGRDDAA